MLRISLFVFISIVGFVQLAYAQNNTLFSVQSPQQTNVIFQNAILEDAGINILNYEYLFNGAGVATGDINNDGLVDIFFTGNMVSNRLYLNKGNWVFEDISEKAGILNKEGYSTGVCMVDINQDGYLDIYVCMSAHKLPELRRNKLYINNKNGTFTERAKVYGLDDPGFSTQAYFADMDLDGDLDAYILNHPGSMTQAKTVNLAYNTQGQLVRVCDTTRQYVSDRYYENVQGKFVDKTMYAGVDNYAYGLSAVLADFNQDHYPDIYVCNDYLEPDYLYINNKNGTFTNRFADYFKHTSASSMGSDYADINNDALPDLFVLDMLPEERARQKQLRGGTSYDNFYKNIRYGLGYQYVKNCLQLNNGNGTFSEIAYYSGVAHTDWSWAPVFHDFDLDGFKDLYVTNGFMRDITDLDYVKYRADSLLKQLKLAKNATQLQQMFSAIPSVKVSNYFFKNLKGYNFINYTNEVGMYSPSWSHGLALADFDNDGDMDMVVNNLFEPAFLYRNNAVELKLGNYVKIKLSGDVGNRDAIGATVEVKTPDGQRQMLSVNPTRGYLSTHESVLQTGIGRNTEAENTVTWPGGKKVTVEKVNANSSIIIEQTSSMPYTKSSTKEPWCKPIVVEGLSEVKHHENDYIDFKLEPLLPKQLSRMGPALSVGDVNADGLDDVFMGGAKDIAGQILVQLPDGRFTKTKQVAFDNDKMYEDVASAFADIDSDGDQDLLVASGGNEYPGQPKMYPLRLYRNDGKGIFIRDIQAIPQHVLSSSKSLSLGDMDLDGDLDIFLGGRSVPGHYGRVPKSYLLQNNAGMFTDISQLVPGIDSLGMITDAVWVDLNGDRYPELAMVGDWMPLIIYPNQQGILKSEAIQYLETQGWWNTLMAFDVNGDNKQDLVGGNLGLNTRYRGNKTFPMSMVVSDFDHNGSTDAVISTFYNGKSTPLLTRDALLDQLVYLRKKFLRHHQYANAEINDIFTAKQLAEAKHLKANDLQSRLFLNTGNFEFTLKGFPSKVQFFPVKSILYEDINRDGIRELLFAGNEYATEVETGRIDAGIGLALQLNQSGEFTPLSVLDSGFYIPGDVQCMRTIQIKGKRCILASRNNDSLYIVQLPD